jgi:hypothetical protein
VALVRTDVSKEHISSIFGVKILRELEITLAVTINIIFTLKMEATHSFETSVLTRATRCHTPEDGILPSRRRENLKFYIALTGWTL